jgi:hypothetical protein
MSKAKGQETKRDMVRAKLAEVMRDATSEPVPVALRDLADGLQRALVARKPAPASDD